MELRDLYQEVILDHNRQPHNNHDMDDASLSADGYNPLCGDKLSLYLKTEGDKIVDASFTGCGCAISTASASLMTDYLKGKSIAEVRHLFDDFHDMVTREDVPPNKSLEKLVVLAGVKAYPSRVKCATLAWHTLIAAVDNQGKVATTE